MKSLATIVTAVLSVVVCVPALRADDFAPPFYRGSAGTVLVTWEFDAPINFADPIAADTFSSVASPFSPPIFYTSPRIIAPTPSDWTWNPVGSISTTNPSGAWLDVIIPGYQGAWDAYARAQYTYGEFLPRIRNLEPLGIGGLFFGPIPNVVDAHHVYDDWGFFQFGSAQVLHLFVDPGTELSEIVVDTQVFPVPTPGTLALAVVAIPAVTRRRRVPCAQR